MCGIFGIINGKKSRNASKAICNVIGEAFVAGSLRGMDSSGLFQIDKNKIYEYKRACSGSEFFGDDQTEAYILDADTAAVTICHNRAATQGEISDSNAHPFSVEHEKNYLVGVHNGTLRGWKDQEDGDKFAVDSDWAINMLARHETKAFQKFLGPYAFVWYDQKNPEILNICRNNERPLYGLYVKDQDRLLIASEFRMLLWLADRNNVSVEHEAIISFTPQRHYMININNPRVFSSAHAPYFTYNPGVATAKEESAAWDMYDDIPWRWRDGTRRTPSWNDTPAEEYIAKWKDLLEAKEKEEEESGEEEAPKEDSAVSTVLPFPSRKAGRITAEEVRMAKTAEILNLEVTFVPEHYDAETKELWGTARTEPSPTHPGPSEDAAAVLQGISAAQFQAFSRCTGGLRCRVGGGRIPATSDIVKELIWVLTRPEASNDNDKEVLSEAIANAIIAVTKQS